MGRGMGDALSHGWRRSGEVGSTCWGRLIPGRGGRLLQLPLVQSHQPRHYKAQLGRLAGPASQAEQARGVLSGLSTSGTWRRRQSRARATASCTPWTAA